MDAYTEHAAGMAELQAENPVAFTWGGASRKCIAGGALRLKEIEAGGFAVDADLSLTCLVADFGYGTTELLVSALIKTRLTYQGHVYRIESVTVAPGEKQFTIKATDLGKGV